MNNMPDLPPVEQKNEQRKVLQFWIKHCHYLEKVIEEQKKLCKDMVNKMTLLQENKNFMSAPFDAKCVCCGDQADSVQKCGHYFCLDCATKNHQFQCIRCAENEQ